MINIDSRSTLHLGNTARLRERPSPVHTSIRDLTITSNFASYANPATITTTSTKTTSPASSSDGASPGLRTTPDQSVQSFSLRSPNQRTQTTTCDSTTSLQQSSAMLLTFVDTYRPSDVLERRPGRAWIQATNLEQDLMRKAPRT